jgi:hypothetical protein
MPKNLEKIIFALVPSIFILFRFSMQQLAVKAEEPFIH